MSRENPKWGASRIHGELLMLGFEVAQSTVSKYMVQHGPPSQSWKTFLRNHAQAIAAIDLCVVPTPIEPVIGHLKEDHRMGRNYLTGRDGDRINAVLAAAGYNFSLLLHWFEEFLRVLS